MSIIRKHTNLKAFTILELVIGMVVSSLVISMVYSIYDNISRQMIQYKNQQDELMEYNQFQSIFHKDIKWSNEIVTMDSEKIALRGTSDTIVYNFLDNAIIRKATASLDTFGIRVINVTYPDKEEGVKNYEIIELTTRLLNNDVTIFESKRNTLATRINTHFSK